MAKQANDQKQNITKSSAFQINKLLQREVSLYQYSEAFPLDSGHFLADLTLVYETYGRLNDDRDNAILICHALTGSAHAAGIGHFPPSILEKAPLLKQASQNKPGWWDALIGPGKLFDTERYYVVCANIIGSCYGSTGPTALNPENGRHYGPDFPQMTVRDMVQAQQRLIRYLSIEQLRLVIGGSLGGMQALEWAVMYPQMVRAIAPIATAVRHSDWCIGFDHAARTAITNDPAYHDGYYETQPRNGLALARQISMISYRSDISFNKRFHYERLYDSDHRFDFDNPFQVQRYLDYQGEKLVNRFDANAFIKITRAMDLHDLSYNRGAMNDVLASIKANSLCISIDSDILYPEHEQKAIASAIPNADYRRIRSINGHDAFLIEFEQMTDIIKPFLQQLEQRE